MILLLQRISDEHMPRMPQVCVAWARGEHLPLQVWSTMFVLLPLLLLLRHHSWARWKLLQVVLEGESLLGQHLPAKESPPWPRLRRSS
jgi:hypothetical protein